MTTGEHMRQDVVANWPCPSDRVRDDPPEYDPAEMIAEEFRDAAREYAGEEAHDAAGEAWQAGAYPTGVTDPGETSGPKGLA